LSLGELEKVAKGVRGKRKGSMQSFLFLVSTVVGWWVASIGC